MDGDELDSVDLQLGPAQPVPADDLSVKIEGDVIAQDHPVHRRVADVLARQREKDPFATAAKDTAPLRESGAGPDAVALEVLGQSLGPTYQRALEDAIRPEIEDELGNGVEPGLGGVGPAGLHTPPCVCVHVGLGGDRIGGWFATPPWFASGAWTPPPPATGRDFWRVGVLLDSAPFNTGVFTLRDGATANPPLARTETLIGLTNATSWAKQIWATNLCSGRVKSVFQRGTNAIAHQMPLIRLSCRQGIDTLEFSKPGFFGAWHDVGHIPPEEFWKHFGGTWAIFDWQVD
jgi:hypothetical protein